MNIKMLITLVTALMLITGCSPKDEEQKQTTSTEDHFLKEKTDALDEASKVEQMLKESEERKRKSLEEQTQ